MATTKWVLDPTHSELGFKIRHLMITSISGSFKSFNAEAEMDDDFAKAKISMTADINSIFTNNEQRDAHLRNSDFFEAEKYPELRFTSTSITKLKGGEYEVNGLLTMKGVTKPVTLQVEYNGIAKDPWGNERTGFVVTAKINRSEWGVNFNAALETGGVALGDEVKISSEIQMLKQAISVAA